tara:strand:+ start:1968 stop:2201 length:234 start_codon:yes stop_codon:yes gene_type:complete
MENKMTKEDHKQEMIIRQSQIKLSLDYFKACGVCPSLTDLMKITTMLEQYIKDGYNKEIVGKFEKIDDYIMKEYKGS